MSILKNNNFYKKQLLITILLIIILNGIILFFYQSTKLKDILDSRISYISSIIHNDFNAKILTTQKEYTLKINKLLSIDGVKEAFASQDRDKLHSLIKQSYQEYKINDNFLKIMTFRLKDNSAFLRMHKPQMHSDGLNKQRKIIIEASKNKKQLFGFEVGKLKMSYRVVTPIFYNNEYIGLVEIGVLPEKFTNNISNLFHTFHALVVKTKYIDISLDKKDYMSENHFSLVKDNAIFKEIFKLSTSQYKDKESFLFIDKKSSYIIENKLHLLNQDKEVVAKILLAYDITDYQKTYHQFKKETIISIIIVSILLLFLLNLSLNAYIKKINASQKELFSEIEKNRLKDQQLLEQSRLAQMGEMLSMIAHQWRQPLSAISATSAGLELKARLNKTDKKTIIIQAQKIAEFSQHLSSTIDDFRDFFKKDKHKKEITYTEIIDSVLTIVYASIENSNIKIIKELNSQKSFQIYPNELKQVLLNLIKNAEDVLIEKDIENPYIKITTYSKDNKHILEISDNGGGVSKDIINKIFDPYFSTKDEKNGTGLGLYMSKTIIEKNCNGILSVSNHNNCAVFKIELENEPNNHC